MQVVGNRVLETMTKNDIEGKLSSSGFNPGEFVSETKDEFAKVVWPDRQQIISESAAVILMVGLSAVSISLIDNLFQWLSGRLFP
jgi:preprotein translocase subunit SecE